MDRRSFLSGGAAAVINSLLDRDQPAPNGTPEVRHWLAQAATRAQAFGKPLLILNPTEPETIWSHFIGYGKDLELYPLAACEIVYAMPATVVEAFPETRERPEARIPRGCYRLAAPQIAVLIETGGPSLSFHDLREPRGLVTSLGRGIDEDDAWEGKTMANNTLLAAAFKGLIAPGREAIYRRLEQYKEAHRGQPSDRFFPTDLDPTQPTRADHISMHAPSILRWIELAKEPPTHLVHAMAEAVRHRAWHQAPPGAKWTYLYDEGPPQSRSVLEFLTSEDPK